MKLVLIWFVALILMLLIFVWNQLNPAGEVILSFTSEHGVHIWDLTVFIPFMVAFAVTIEHLLKGERNGAA